MQEINEEFKEAVNSNPEVQKQLIEFINESEFGKTFVSNAQKTHFDDAVKPFVKEIHEKYDADIMEITGKSKPDGVKTYEHLKSVLSELGKGANTDGLTAEISKLKKELESKGQGDSHYKDMYEQSLKGLEEMKAQFTGLKKDYQSKEIDSRLRSEMSKFSFKKELPKSMIDAYSNLVLTELKGNMETLEDGTMIFKDANGKTITNSDFSAPMSASDVLASKFAEYLDTGRQQTGGGAKGDGASLNTGSILKSESGHEYYAMSSDSVKSTSDVLDAVNERLTAEGIDLKGSRANKILQNSVSAFHKTLK